MSVKLHLKMSGCFFETQCRPCSPTSVLVTVFIIVWLCNIITQHTDDSNNCQWALHQQKKYVLLATVSAKISILCKHKQHTCILLGRSAYTQCIKMQHLLQRSHLVWLCLCLYVCMYGTRVSCAKWLNQSRCCFHVLDGGPDPPWEKTLLRETCGGPL